MVSNAVEKELRIRPWTQLIDLLRAEKRIMSFYAATSLARALAASLVIVLVYDFLGGVLGDEGGLSGQIKDRFGQDFALWTVAGLLLLAYLATSVTTYINTVLQQQIVKVVELGLMERLVRHLLTLSVPFFDRQRHGDIIQAVRQDVSAVRGLVVSLAGLFLDGALALALTSVALWLSPWLFLWSCVVLPIVVLPIYLSMRGLLSKSYQIRRAGYVLFDLLLEILRGIRVIKAYRGEESEAKLCVDKGRDYFDGLIGLIKIQALTTEILSSAAGLGVVVVIVAGGFEVMNGNMAWPSLLAFVMAMRQLHRPLNAIVNYVVLLQSQRAAADRVSEILSEKPDVSDRPDARPLTQAPHTITLENVHFSYGETPVLKDISFKVQAGETIGIVGLSGAGKTTLLNLVARFYDPTEGRVLFDDCDVRDLRIADVYEQMAIVTQEPFLFATSVMENIRCGRPEATDEEVEQAAKAAYIHKEISALPDGYETMLGGGGRGLSIGQQQRVNVARALLKNAPLLLLDEATSSLDSFAEEEVQKAVDGLQEGRTSFVIAHRLSTLRNADRLLVLVEGRCEAMGTHSELIESCEIYRKMWKIQSLTAPDS